MPAAWRNAAVAADNRLALDLTQWWTGFNDPTLNRLVRQAAAENLTLREAAARVEEARAAQQATLAGLLPGAVGGATVQGTHLFGNDRVGTIALPAGFPGGSGTAVPVIIGQHSFADYQPGIAAAWDLPLFGRGAAERKLSDGAVGAALADQAAARVTLVSGVARNYIEIRADQQRKALLTENLAASRHLANLVEIRRGAGLASDLDVDRARNAADQVATRLAPLEGDIRAAQQQLAILRGSSEPDDTLTQPAPLPTAPTASLRVVPVDLLRVRPGIVQAEQNVIANAGALGIAVANLYPRLTLVGSVGAVGSINGGMSGPTVFLSGGPSITIPLLDWGARLDQTKARNAALAASILHYRQAVLTGVAAVETALAHVAAARDQIAAARREVVSSEHALHGADLLYGRGLIPLSDRLDSQRAYLEARLGLVTSVQSEAIAAIALYHAIGGAMTSAATTGDAASTGTASGHAGS
jgi:NodT family efflux transporter outer membrane factor (OMF) lipoprotein